MASQQRQKEVVITYDDQISRWFLMATLLWGVVGMLVGVIVAVQLAYWPSPESNVQSFNACLE